MSVKDINPEDCRVVLASPVHYEECVILVETADEYLFILTDEQLTGSCIVEFPGDGEAIVRRIPLESLRALLDAAERKLLGKEESEPKATD